VYQNALELYQNALEQLTRMSLGSKISLRAVPWLAGTAAKWVRAAIASLCAGSRVSSVHDFDLQND
jgi:hypothetical protein